MNEERLFGMIRMPFLPVRISVFAVIALAAFVTADSSIYAFLVLLAAALHELAHTICVILCGERVELITIYPFGADMRISGGDAAMLPPQKELAVYSSGIIMNLALAVAFFFVKGGYAHFFAMSNLALAVMNLIPVRGLDGGRIADCLIYRSFPLDMAEKLSPVVSYVSFGILCLLAFFAMSASGYNLITVFMCGYLALSVYFKGIL